MVIEIHVAHIHLVAAGQPLIEAQHHLVAGQAGSLDVVEIVLIGVLVDGRRIGKRYVRKQLGSHRIEAAGRDDIAGKRRAGPAVAARILHRGRGIVDRIERPLRGLGLAEVAATFEERRNGGKTGRLPMVQVTFVVEEEERAVLTAIDFGNPHRTSSRAPVLVIAEKGSGGGEGVPRIQCVVAEIFVGRPVIRVGAALGRHVDHTAEREAVLRRHSVRQDLELGDRIHGRVRVDLIQHGIVVVPAVDGETVVAGRAAVDADIG